MPSRNGDIINIPQTASQGSQTKDLEHAAPFAVGGTARPLNAMEIEHASTYW